MPLFHVPTEALEADAMRILAELAARQHAGDCAAVHVRYICEAYVAGGLVFDPRKVPDAPAADQAGYERDTLAHWLALVPDLDSVTVVVRRYGKVVRTAMLEHPALTRASAADERQCPGSED